MRYGKLVLGLIVVVLALWIMIGEQMSGASANAVVNAPVVTVRAPVAGNLQVRPRQLGSRVSRGEVIASIQDPLVDRVRLDDLLMEAQFETAARQQIEQILLERQLKKRRMTERSEIFRTHRLEELQTQLTHAQERLDIIAALDPADLVQSQLLETVEGGAEQVPAAPRLQALVLEHAQERVAVLETAMRAAEQGVFLGDGYNDAPFSEQRAFDLDSDIAALTTELAQVSARLEAVQDRIGRERIRVNIFTGGDITAPVGGSYWEILQADGVNVQRGDPIIRLVNCESPLVTLSVTERVYNQLEVGQPATFRMTGSSTLYEATIGRLAGSGAASIYENFAVAPSQQHLERFDVTLIVPELRQSVGSSCAIGRTGRAFFETRPLDWLRGLFS